MSDSARFRITSEISTATDYSNPYHKKQFEDTFTPDEVRLVKLEVDTGGGTTYTTSAFSTITSLAVRNIDATNFVTMTFRSAGNGSTDNKIKLLPGEMFFTSDFTASGNLVFIANTAALVVDLILAGT